jgi:hypothetical protein
MPVRGYIAAPHSLMFIARQPVCSNCSRFWMFAALTAAGVVGCQKSAEIVHYRVPKEQEVSLPIDEAAPGESPIENSAADAKSDRMLTAIVPHGDTAWFFKLSGPVEAVAKHADTFQSLIQSVSFPKSAGGKPIWKLPEGWHEKPGSQMRFATLTLPAENTTGAPSAESSAKPLEVSVTSLPWSSKDESEQLLANVNRWRGQMQLKPLAAAEFAGETHSLQLFGEGKATATLVDLTGHMNAGGMQPPFAGGAAKTTGLPPRHPDTSGRLPPGHPAVTDDALSKRPPMAAAANAAPPNEPGHPSLTGQAIPDARRQSSDAATDADLPFAVTVPKTWKSAPLPTFAVAAFAISENSPRPEVTITPLPEAAGGIDANVNRWRGKLGLPPASDDELKATAQPYEVDGQSGHLVRLLGPEDSTPRQAITAIVLPHDGVNWIFALKATADLAKNEQANFEKFVSSVKFRNSDKK